MELRAVKWVLCALGAAALALDVAGAAAQDGDGRPASHRDEHGGRGQRRPPAEAFSACEGKSEGAECQVQHHERTIDGVCVAPSKEALFCMPNDMPPPPPGGGPPQDR
ncbi:MAG TPA: hypothetical protein VFZ61_09240 [Polyangiales bacterium]